MYIESKGVLALDLKEHGFYDIIEKVDEHKHEMVCLMDKLHRVEPVIETTINPPGSESPLSITLKSEPVCEILRQIEEHKKAICDLFIEMKMLTAAVESNINEKLRAATTLPESPVITMDVESKPKFFIEKNDHIFCSFEESEREDFFQTLNMLVGSHITSVKVVIQSNEPSGGIHKHDVFNADEIGPAPISSAN